MPLRLPRKLPDLDRLAMGLSGLCAVHCVATTVLVAMMSVAGGALLDPHIHEVGLVLAIALGALALGRGALRHGRWLPVALGAFGLGVMAGAMALPHEGGGEAIWTIAGVALLALAHEVNRRMAARSGACRTHPACLDHGHAHPRP